MAAAAVLSGCSSSPQGWAPWWFISLAFVLAVGGSFALGTLRARQRLGRELRTVRGELRRLIALQRAWAWETDREHRLRNWRSPAIGRRDNGENELTLAEGGRNLFGPGTISAEALRSHLRAERPFSALHARSGEHEWIIDGTPRFDDQGRFAGYVGQAQPVPAVDELGPGGDTLRQVLTLLPGPALLALQQPDRWIIRHLNAMGQSHWPRLAVGRNLAEAWTALPGSFASTLESMLPGGSVEAEGWRMARLRIDNGRQAVLIVRHLAGGATAESAEVVSSTLSHDLRAPLRVVEGFTRIVKEDYGAALDRIGNEHLDRVLSAAARMNQMIDALLTMSRLSSHPLARQPVDLTQLANFVIDDLRRGAPERVVQVDIESNLSATGDPTLLRMVLENLLGNAWKYSARTPAAHIVFRRVTQGGRTWFAVGDNGAGFEMQTADRLFGLFQRLHSASEFPGHGVGLASVKRIVQRHGGDVWAHGEPGVGATFCFTLPG